MLEELIGSSVRERVLLYIANYGEGYARAIAQTFGYSVGMVQRQLQRLEKGGVLVSLSKGRTRIFTWNPRYCFRRELADLMRKALGLMSPEENRRYYRQRRRPRRSGKPL